MEHGKKLLLNEGTVNDQDLNEYEYACLQIV